MIPERYYQKVSLIDRCLICRKPLNIANQSGYCKRHGALRKKLKYQNNEEYRKSVLARNASWHKEHADEIRARRRDRYLKNKAEKTLACATEGKAPESAGTPA